MDRGTPGRGPGDRRNAPLNLGRFEQEVAEEIDVALRRERKRGGRRKPPGPEGAGPAERPR